MKSFKLALIQVIPFSNPEQNAKRAIDLIETAVENGATFIALPEMFYTPFEPQALRNASYYAAAILAMLKETAKTYGIHLCTGSLPVEKSGSVYNAAFLLDPQGNEILSHKKCHLYDVSFGAVQSRESSLFSAGNSVHIAHTDLGTVGMLMCYDIRFPEMARHLTLSGAELIIVPAVFNDITGAAHWNVLMRARAIENQVFLAAISQGKNPKAAYKAYGHSMVVSPWGDILTEADERETIVYATLDPQILENTRKRLPLLNHRRPDLYNSFDQLGSDHG